MNEDTSSVNTILIVLVLVLIVGGFVWFFTSRMQGAPQPSDGIDVNVKLPEMPTGDKKDDAPAEQK